jgi:tRNA (mo5U34)-methyltransferase
MERLNPAEIAYHKMNVYELADKQLGQFDIVLFMGVLYHLPDMIRALHVIRQSCRGTLFIETRSENDFCRDIAAARYCKGSTLANDHTNFWVPNRLCIFDMLHDTGFDVERDEAWGDRLFVVAKPVQTKGERSQKMQIAYSWVGGRPD